MIAALPPRANAIAVDRPGWNGGSKPLDLAGNARAALALLDARGIERATVVGHSLGGAIAAWLAVTAPERVAGLVLAAPAANLASLNRLDYILAAPVAGYLTSAAAMAGFGLALRAGPVRSLIAGRSGIGAPYLRDAAPMLLAPAAWRAFTLEQRWLVRDLQRLEPMLAEIRAPTRIVGGRADRIVAPSSLQRLAEQIPGAELTLLDRAGHLLPHLHASRLAAVIARFENGQIEARGP